ncbi:MAG: hypothetical protein NWE83_06070 [Candidatus Bathyarchaeota archaeon]|nr:hypothetical protein [Candidatus Bathyarchaeota archaeon]
MGIMTTIQVMRHLLKEWRLPDSMTISWNPHNVFEVAHATDKFHEYLQDGWMAFRDEPSGRTQIFTFDPSINRILLIPPLGGG